MPKKTKKEKLIAEARRIIRESQMPGKSVSPVVKSVNNPEQTQKSAYQWTTDKSNYSAKTQNDELEFSVIRKDLIKTIVLASAAVLVELMLFWKFR
jgi:uncharacterized membrane protein